MDKVSDTPRTDAVKSYQERCEMLHGDNIVTHAMCFARASEEADELHSLCEKLEEELAAAIASFGEERERARREGERVIAAISQRDKALAFLQCYRHDTPLGHQPYMLAHEVDLLLKECGK